MRYIVDGSDNQKYLCLFHIDEELEGIYKEADESIVPEGIKNIKEGGAGVHDGDWFVSNTSGPTYGKYYKKVADRIFFDLENREKLESIKDQSSFREGLALIEQYVRQEDLEFNFSSGHSLVEGEETCLFSLIMKESDYIPKPHPMRQTDMFGQFCQYFVGKEKAIITLVVTMNEKEMNNNGGFLDALIEKRRTIKQTDTIQREHLNQDELEEILLKYPTASIEWQFSFSTDRHFSKQL